MQVCSRKEKLYDSLHLSGDGGILWNHFIAWTDSGWRRTFRVNDHGAKVDPDSPIPQLLTEATCQVTGQTYKPYWMFAGTYSRHLDNSYTVGSRVHDPASAAVLPELPAGHGGAHQRDEVCIVDDFLLGVRLLANCILVCDQAT